MGAIHTLVVIVMVTVTIGCWVGESEMLQGLQEPKSANYYPRPYFMTWFVRLGYLAYLPLWVVVRTIVAGIKKKKEAGPGAKFALAWPGLDATEIKVLKHGTWLALIFWFSLYLWYFSLPHTSVAGNTIVFNLGPVAVLPLSVLLLGDYVSILRCVAILLCIVGMIVVVTASNGQKEAGGDKQSIGGYIAIFFSMVLFAIFEVMFGKFVSGHEHHAEKQHGAEHFHGADGGGKAGGAQKSVNDEPASENQPLLNGVERKGKIVDEEDADEVYDDSSLEADPFKGLSDMCLFLALTGLINLFVLWSGILILNYTGWETFEMPTEGDFRLLYISMAFDVTLQFTWLFSIVLTSPMFMAMASLLGIPTSIFSDFFLHGAVMKPIAILGTIVIFIGFFSYAAGPLIRSPLFRCVADHDARARLVETRIFGGRVRIF